ncbi:proliferating cell nuclear antigen, putative [Plasmodium gallinaceum]|uniref:DNA sliding clamp PCNA n=1 Tax=Plasmodium gallinaceum TaxID=5849 RepID=A0A1J1GND3_PLAGA|nr:proliferating cell nuclear antigen, putative [Plasmodium gallinaceum]CRG93975.1 proliferating cell nuclear antigen, putative [Plasmodium gallinaceum]
MLEAKLNNASILKKLFECIKDLVNDANVDADETGLKLQALDGNHVSLVSLHLLDSGFSHYRCDRERVLGVNIASLNKVFKLCAANESVVISSKDDEDNLNFVFENNKEDKVTNFSLKLMSIELDSLNIPDCEEGFDAEVELSSKELTNIFRNLSEFSDTVFIEIDSNSIKFTTKGLVGDAEVALKPRDSTSEDDIGVNIKSKKKIKQSFAIKYLNLFSKSSILSDVVTLGLSDSRPIEFKYEIKDTSPDADTLKIGFVKFFLAPKMDDDMDNKD